MIFKILFLCFCQILFIGIWVAQDEHLKNEIKCNENKSLNKKDKQNPYSSLSHDLIS